MPIILTIHPLIAVPKEKDSLSFLPELTGCLLESGTHTGSCAIHCVVETEFMALFSMCISLYLRDNNDNEDMLKTSDANLVCSVDE